MKKSLFLLISILSMPGIAQTEVNTFFSGANEGVTYYLPDTRIEIVVNTTCITRTPGEFNPYAQRYLRINNAISKSESHWEMNGIEVETTGVPNREKMYTVKLNSSTAGNISLDKNGIIAAINHRITDSMTGQETAPQNNSSAHADATQYMTEELLQATSTAKLAELTAKEIYAIRESKLNITRGLSEKMPQDGMSMKLVLDELNKQEHALTELFTGRIDTTHHCYRFVIDPKLDCDTTKAVLFRFSRKSGVVDKEDLSGSPVYYDTRDLKSVKKPTAEELAKKKKQLKMEGICYTIPGKMLLDIYTITKTLYKEEVQVAQYGTTEVLSKTMFTKDESPKVLFDTATGGITGIEK